MNKQLRSILLVLTLWQAGTHWAFAQINLSSLNTPYSQNFNSLATTGTTNDVSTLPAGWLFLETGTNANTTYAAGTGSSNTGNTYSFGIDADRALGGLLSGSLVPGIGASFTNTTGSIITSLQINYAGEQWRLGATPRAQADRLDFQYSLTATSLATGTWQDVDELDFNAPILSGTIGALNGNQPANRTVIAFTISGLNIPSGATFWIRWNDFNVAGSDDGLAVDDFTIIPSGIPSNQPSITINPASLTFGELNLGNEGVKSYTIKSANLSDSIHITASIPQFSVSLDQITYANTLTIKDSAIVFVKFAPTANGNFSGIITNSSGALSKQVNVSGSGYDPLSNIIAIAIARTKSTGTKVTVAGRITVANEQGSPSFIQDATGGIPVFNTALSNAVAIGDSVLVTGPIGLFNDQKQISGAGITFTVIDTTKKYVVPKPIDITELAANEGLLVRVQQVELVNKAFVFYPQSTEQMTNGSVQADLRIDGDTNIPGLTKPQGSVDIIGVVGRFKTKAQLLPRFQSDVPGAEEPQTPADSIPKNVTFDVMNWNLEFFGAESQDYKNKEYGPADEPLQLENVKKLIINQQPDVIAVQEVSSDSLFTALVHQLPGYASICSDRYSYSFNGPSSDFPPQKVCFIYDSTKVVVQSFKPLFESLYDSARTIDPSLLPGYPTGDASSFWSSGRLPFMMTALVTIQGITERISFVNLHAKSGATSGDFNRRQYDANKLHELLGKQYANEKIVVLGDLNDDLDQSIATGNTTPYASFVNDSSYLSITKSLSLAGAKSTVSFNDVIDHQIISRELSGDYVPASEKVVIPFRLLSNYASTTSDHLPVASRYMFTAPTAHLASTTATANEGDTVSITVILSKAVVYDTRVNVSVNAGISVTTSDYSLLGLEANQLVIPAGNSSATFNLIVTNDSEDELTETLTVQLTETTGIKLDNPAVFTVTMLDNDVPVIEFVESEVSREEGSGAYQIKLRLSTAPVSEQQVVIRASNGRGVFYGNRWDYTTTPEVNQASINLQIPAGTREVSFTVTPNSDYLREIKPEIVTFSISSISSGLITGGISSLKFSIIDVRPCIPLFAVFPNPTWGPITIFTLPENNNMIVKGTLISPSGDIISTGEASVSQLSEQFSGVMQGRARGIYILKLEQCQEVIQIRIFKF